MEIELQFTPRQLLRWADQGLSAYAEYNSLGNLIKGYFCKIPKFNCSILVMSCGDLYEYFGFPHSEDWLRLHGRDIYGYILPKTREELTQLHKAKEAKTD